MIVPMFLHPLSAPPMSSLPALHRRGGVLEAADRHLVYGSGAIVAAPPRSRTGKSIPPPWADGLTGIKIRVRLYAVWYI